MKIKKIATLLTILTIFGLRNAAFAAKEIKITVPTPSDLADGMSSLASSVKEGAKKAGKAISEVPQDVASASKRAFTEIVSTDAISKIVPDVMLEDLQKTCREYEKLNHEKYDCDSRKMAELISTNKFAISKYSKEKGRFHTNHDEMIEKFMDETLSEYIVARTLQDYLTMCNQIKKLSHTYYFQRCSISTDTVCEDLDLWTLRNAIPVCVGAR